jgi:hypothetical protein
MATRSRIAIEQADGTVKSIYCHWDGYPKGNGRTLVEHYGDRAKVESLIALGDISVLGERVEPTDPKLHGFNRPEEGTTVAYHRDREEEFRRPRVDRSLQDFMDSDVEEFGYLFTAAGEWMLIDGHRKHRELKNLEEILSLRLS